MFYIEKNDKPTWIEKIIPIIKVENNTIKLPYKENINQNKIEKLAQKTKKILEKNSTSKKVVLSKEIQKENLYINYLNTYGLKIQDGRWLFEILITDIIEYIINKKKLETSKLKISMLINDITDFEIENIKLLAKKYKNLNIVTNHIEKIKKIEEELLEKEGIMITVTNNRKKSLVKSDIIYNVDFPEEILNKYVIKDDAIIINLRGKMKIKKKRFNGIIINNYEINLRDDKKDEKMISKKYYFRDIYQAELYQKQGFNNLKEKVKKDNVWVSKLFLSNGEI